MNYYNGREMDMDNKNYAHLITVIVPIYNVCEYLERCVNSIINQTYANLEIILVDDGSTDGSEEICEQYLKKDSRIKVIHKENGGLVSARKAGLEKAGGEYIGFVDADDYIDKSFYEHLLDNLIDTGSDISQMGYIIESEEKTEHCRCILETFNIEENREDYLCNGLILMGNRNFNVFYNVWTKLYKAELIKKAYAKVPNEQQYGEDLISTCSCLLECKVLSTVSYEEYHYQLRENSLSHIQPIDNIIQVCHLYERMWEIFKHINGKAEIKDALDKFLFRNLIINIERIGDIHIPKHYLRGVENLRNKEIIIYGSGNVGKDFYLQLTKYYDIKIVAVADGNPSSSDFEYRGVIGSDKINNFKYDMILIAVYDGKMAKEISNELVLRGIEKKDIYWEKPSMIYA